MGHLYYLSMVLSPDALLYGSYIVVDRSSQMGQRHGLPMTTCTGIYCDRRMGSVRWYAMETMAARMAEDNDKEHVCH